MRWIEMAGTILFAATATAAMAGDSFRDVPRGHWAYKALRNLRHAKIIRGWKGRYYGRKTFTRYEMAVVLARYLEQLRTSRDGIRKSVEKTYPLLERLSREFARELDLLGVKSARLTSRMDRLEKGLTSLRTLVGRNQEILARVAGRLNGLKTTPARGTPVARLPASLGGNPVHGAADVDRILADTIVAVRKGRISKTQAYSIGYLAQILYRRVRDAGRPGLNRGVDKAKWKRKIARLERNLSVKRAVARRHRETLGQAE